MAGELSVRYNEQYMNKVFCSGPVWRNDRQEKRGRYRGRYWLRAIMLFYSLGDRRLKVEQWRNNKVQSHLEKCANFFILLFTSMRPNTSTGHNT